MGIGTLRRYHQPLTVEGVSNEAPSGVSGPSEAEQAELDAKTAAADAALEEARQAKLQESETEAAKVDAAADALREANEAKLANEQQDQADLANHDGEAQSVNPIVQEVGGEEHNPAEVIPPTVPTLAPGETSENGAEHDQITEGTPVTPGTPEGEQEQQEAAQAAELTIPNRGSSTKLWLDYSAAHQAAQGLEPVEGIEELTRDEIAELYLGPRS